MLDLPTMHLSPLSDSQPDSRPSRDGIPGLRAGIILACVLLALALAYEGVSPLFKGCAKDPAKQPDGPAVAATNELESALADLPRLRFVNPTPQSNLSATNSPEVYMPTASGRQESALYGATRSDAKGPRWHEGVDLAPVKRDSRRRPLDEVFAVADGKVAYVNSVAGNSSYGRYIVVTHDDPIGWIYTLYAHLDSIEKGIEAGRKVTAGQTIARMGYSSSVPGAITIDRAHLHFEVGVFINSKYPEYMAEIKSPLTHGAWDGRNLFGINPLSMLLGRADDGTFSMLENLRSQRAAITVAVKVDPARLPEYFRHYPALDECAKASPAPKVRDRALLDIAESGVPLRLRPWPDTEAAPEAKALPQVFGIDEKELGLNARGFVRKREGKWELTETGKRFVAQLFFPIK